MNIAKARAVTTYMFHMAETIGFGEDTIDINGEVFCIKILDDTIRPTWDEISDSAREYMSSLGNFQDDRNKVIFEDHEGVSDPILFSSISAHLSNFSYYIGRGEVRQVRFSAEKESTKKIFTESMRMAINGSSPMEVQRAAKVMSKRKDLPDWNTMKEGQKTSFLIMVESARAVYKAITGEMPWIS